MTNDENYSYNIEQYANSSQNNQQFQGDFNQGFTPQQPQQMMRGKGFRGGSFRGNRGNGRGGHRGGRGGNFGNRRWGKLYFFVFIIY